MPGRRSSQSPGTRTTAALEAPNFFMADFQAGIGPFLGIFLLAHGWASGWIGSVMTLGSMAGILMTAPAGAFIDATRYKRASVILASAFLLWSQQFWVVGGSQVATAIAGAAILPAVTGITLALVGQSASIDKTDAIRRSITPAT
jgi:hypothetical protein